MLFGARNYGEGVDIYAVGCIVAELLLRIPLFPGDSDLGQLSKIFEVLGTPNDTNWPDHRLLPDYCEFKETVPIPMPTIFTAAPDDLISLIENLLRLCPNDRCSSKTALQHPYFRFVEIIHFLKLLSLKREKKKRDSVPSISVRGSST